MTAKLFEALGGKLGERWLLVLISPAAVFWAGGFGAWVLADGWDDSGGRIADWFDGLSGAEQAIVAIGALLAVAGSAVVVGQLALPVLRLLEG